MNKDICAINFTGLTHDHTCVHSARESPKDETTGISLGPNEFCSVISILKRHPMYDCLVLVKKYRNCLAGYSLEFPIDRIRENERIPTNESAKHQNSENNIGSQEQLMVDNVNRSACSQRRLVSRFLDGDDPMYQADVALSTAGSSSSLVGDEASAQQPSAPSPDNSQQENQEDQQQTVDIRGSKLPFMLQLDDRDEKCELVHVPVNGLLDRLENYTRSGIAVDSRVYAFAMGLKTAERMMTTKSMKELQETPI